MHLGQVGTVSWGDNTSQRAGLFGISNNKIFHTVLLEHIGLASSLTILRGNAKDVFSHRNDVLVLLRQTWMVCNFAKESWLNKRLTHEDMSFNLLLRLYGEVCVTLVTSVVIYDARECRHCSYLTEVFSSVSWLWQTLWLVVAWCKSLVCRGSALSPKYFHACCSKVWHNSSQMWNSVHGVCITQERLTLCNLQLM